MSNKTSELHGATLGNATIVYIGNPGNMQYRENSGILAMCHLEKRCAKLETKSTFLAF